MNTKIVLIKNCKLTVLEIEYIINLGKQLSYFRNLGISQ
jgi:hypothetical protein